MQSPIPAPPVASLADFIRGHQRAPGRTSSRVTAGVLTAMLYVSLVLLARLLSAPDFQPPTEIFATVVTDGPVKKIVRAPPPFLAHLIRPHAESIAPPAFTVAPDVPAAPTTLMASAVQSSPVTAGVSAGTGADGQGISGKGMTASGSNGNGDDLAGCWDKSWAQAVADRVRQFSYYPPAARRDHKTGVVMVHLSVRRYGTFPDRRLNRLNGGSGGQGTCVDDWNDVVIIAKGKNIKHYLNGQLVVDFTDDEPKLAASEGILALQLHAGAPMWVEFKSIRLKQLK